MSVCLLCPNALTGDEPPEHILLNALGGRLVETGVLCAACNHELGGGPDRALSDTVHQIRVWLNLRSGNRRPPPPLRETTADGTKFKLAPGGVPRLERHKPFEVIRDAAGNILSVRILVADVEELDRLIPHLSAQLGHEPAAVRQWLSSGSWTHNSHPVGVVQKNLSFGGPDAIRSMAKATLVLWARHQGHDEARRDCYAAARTYIRHGSDDMTVAMTRLDTRVWPPEMALPEEIYGKFPNSIVVASNSAGRVVGYFRLYNAIGWSVVLAEQGGIADRRVVFASNPEQPSQHSDQLAGSCSVDFDWINTASYAGGLEPVAARVRTILKEYEDSARNSAVDAIVGDIFRRAQASVPPGEPAYLTDELIGELSARAASLFTRMPHSRSMSAAEVDRMLRSNPTNKA